MSLARWTRILPWLAVVAVLLLACFQVENRDLWWHLAAGRWAVEQGQPPTTDIFAQGDPGPWVNESWLAQVLFWGVERVGGAAGLVLSKLLLLGGLFTLLVRFLQPRVGPVVAAWLVLVTGVGMWERLMVRPELFTFLASLAVYLLCRRYEATGTRWVWGLLGIQLLWANLHNGFLFGILLVGCLWVGMLLDARVHRRWAEPAVRARAREWGLVLLALPVVSCLTPNGPALLIEPVRHLGETYLFRVAEWKSLSAVFPGYATVVFGVTLLLAGGSLLLNRRAVRIGDSLLLLALFCMAWRYHRFVALLVLLAGPIIAENLAGWRRANSFTQTLRNAARSKFGWLERVPGRAGCYAPTDLGRSVTLGG